MLALIDGKILTDARGERRVVVVPAGRQFFQGNRVRFVAIDLVGAHVDEHGVGRISAGGLQQVEGPDGIDIEVIERP